MNGLILKDIYNLKGSMCFILLLSVLFALLFSWEMPEGMILVCATMSASLVSGSFSFDHSYGWNAHAVSIGIPRDMIVRSKFETGIMFTSSGVLMGLIIAILFQIAMGRVIDPYQMLSSSVMSLGVGMVTASVICVINYHINPQRAQLVSTFTTAVCVSGSVIACNMMRELIPNIPIPTSAIALVIGIVMFAITYIISQRKFANTDL